MKILFCSPTRLDRALGGPKVVLELADGLRELGCECDLIGPTEVDATMSDAREDPSRYSLALREYLHRRAGDFDVVDYDHEYLPFPREEFPRGTLMVARSVLLHYHFGEIAIPQPQSPAASARRVVRGFLDRRQRMERRRRADRTGRQADLFVTLNQCDRDCLIRHGYEGSKIVVVGLGLKPQRLRELTPESLDPGSPPRIAFVGTFDYRKGCLDLPRIAERVIGAIPEVRFRLLGTRGLFTSVDQVLSHFPKSLRPSIEVHSRFDPADLPSLLRPCCLGLFPSYIEGFGFGILEMLAAGLPVMAYDAPGPKDILPQRWLIRRGDTAAMADRLTQLLSNPDQLKSQRIAASLRAAEFPWTAPSEKMLHAYQLARASLASGSAHLVRPSNSQLMV